MTHRMCLRRAHDCLTGSHDHIHEEVKHITCARSYVSISVLARISWLGYIKLIPHLILGMTRSGNRDPSAVGPPSV